MEKRVKHSSFLAAASMPHKIADFGPSPNSIDDNGNVSFESHSNDYVGQFGEKTKKEVE
jgi:hypothetical protein